MKVLKLLLPISILVISFSSCTKDDDPLMNVVPVADAGTDKTVTLPANVTLTGTGTDPDGQIKAYLWSQVSGPAASVITNPGSATTEVKFSLDGTYVFQLMVTDDMGATGVDIVTVLVNPAPEITVTLQPANNPDEITLAIINGSDATGHSADDIPIEAWTTGGNPLTFRSLLKFDLSAIPQNSAIVSANLYLYSYPPPTPNGNFNDPNFGTNNSMILQRVTADWSPSTVTWFNQPGGTSQDQISIPHTTSSSLDLNIDVKNLVSTMVAGNSNYGFLIRLQNEVVYNSRIFVSSYNTTYTSKHPKLVIIYK